MTNSRKTFVSGIVRSLDRTRGFGFLQSDDSERDIFFSLNDVPSYRDSIGVGSALRGEVIQGQKGPRLASITVVSTRRVSPYALFASLAALAALGITTAVSINFEVSLLAAWLIGINSGAVFFMGLDKSLARSASVRTPETVIFVLALLGGSPGALLGIHVFRHKTRKAAFQFVLLLIFGGQAAVLRLLDFSLRR